MLHIMQCSFSITSLSLPPITPRIQMTVMETHPIFWRSISSEVLVIVFNHQSFYISWRKDKQRNSFLELILLASKFWTYKAKLLMYPEFWGSKSNSRPLPRRETNTLKFFGSYSCKTWGFSRLTSRAQRTKIYCRPHSCKNASTSRARTGRHRQKHPGQRRWASSMRE